MSEPNLNPFACRYTPHLPELLTKMNCSLAITTYQAGKVVIISPKDENTLTQLPRTFKKPMGISYDAQKNTMVLATQGEVITFKNSVELASTYPNAPGVYDALFLPRLTYHTAPLDLHDIHVGKDNEIFAVNTLFSCIVKIEEAYNFTPIWTPPFIDAIASEDRCHLNGLAMRDGKPAFATAFNSGNTASSWRENITETGIIMDIEKNKILADGLAMPHSPKWINNKLYVLLSATGELVEIDAENGEKKVIYNFNAFVRGLAFYKDYLFVGFSKLRKNSSTFSKIQFSHEANEAGIAVFHLPTASLSGKITYENSVDEIYDLIVLPNCLRPNILNTMNDIYKSALITPNATYWGMRQKEE